MRGEVCGRAATAAIGAKTVVVPDIGTAVGAIHNHHL
jgi:hypothetical protein